MSFANLAGFAGPLDPPEGTDFDAMFTAAARTQILDATGVTISWRRRQQWGRGKKLAANGPPHKLIIALEMAVTLCTPAAAANTAAASASATAPAPASTLAPKQEPTPNRRLSPDAQATDVEAKAAATEAMLLRLYGGADSSTPATGTNSIPRIRLRSRERPARRSNLQADVEAEATGGGSATPPSENAAIGQTCPGCLRSNCQTHGAKNAIANEEYERRLAGWIAAGWQQHEASVTSARLPAGADVNNPASPIPYRLPETVPGPPQQKTQATRSHRAHSLFPRDSTQGNSANRASSMMQERSMPQRRRLSPGAAARPPAGVAAALPHVPPPTRVVPFLHNELHEVRPEYDYDWTLCPHDRAEEYNNRTIRNRMIKEELQKGRPVVYRSSGWSLFPRVHSNDMTHYVPVTRDDEIQEDDIVFCEVQPGDRFYAHLVKSKYRYEGGAWCYIIANLAGRENGWCSLCHIYGRLISVLH